MLHIAICDDDLRIVNDINNILFNFSKTESIDMKLFNFCDGTELLSSSENFDVIFLDIEMKYSNGIEIAQRIHEKNMSTPIIFITNYADYWRRAFSVHAFCFIVKPLCENEVVTCFNDLIKLINISSEAILLPTENGTERFELKDILYFIFESKKKVYVHTKNGRVIIKKNLSDIYDMLDTNQFYQTRRDCIVNLRHVKKLQNEYVIVTTDGSLLPLAQKKKDEFMKKLSTEFVKNLKGRKI